ncbi:MAG: histidinol-phosphatase HisJ family protein [Eubacterium sp.]|nr:histidinol-phosphatase HisJ family protein [Eubacterium sp.]
MLWDTHMHTRFSEDSNTPERMMADAAIKKGLSGICITDHMDLDFPDGSDLFVFDVSEYMQAMKSLRQQYTGRLHILIGIELGLQTHLSAAYHALFQKEPDFDFVIGSSHVVHRMDPYYPEYFNGRNEEDGYLEYFESILENIHACSNFDVYGHLDYVVRYGPNKNRDYSYRKYADIIDEILKTLISRGKGIEINMSGYRYGLGHPNPTEDIIKRYRELGGEILTIGADAHEPEHIAYRFEKIPDLLHHLGFTHFTIFHKRKPQFISI